MAKAQPQPASAPTQASAPQTTAGSLLDRIKAQVAAMDPEQVKIQLVKLKEHKEKQKAKRGSLNEEQRTKRTAYNKARLARAEVKEKMKAYRSRPEVKEKQKAYRKARVAGQKALLERARELGITV
jgi:hypothetical protein